MERLNPHSRSDPYGKRINRQHSSVLAIVLPWVSIAAGSLLPLLVIATALPIVPPLGFLMLVAWRLVRPGLLPVWAGLPLGLLDDLYNGQPFGFAILAWSLAMLGIEAIESRFPWRSYLQDWITAGVLILAYLVAGWLLSGGEPTRASFVALAPQMVLSVLAFPLIERIVAQLDRIRLQRWKTAP